MAISIRRITCREAWENPAWPAIVEQYKKDVQHVEYMPDVDEAMYFRCELSGTFYSIGAFDGENLVGVVSFFETPLPIKKGAVVARSELLWVSPALRGQGVAKHLMKAASDLAASHGCLGFYWGVRKETVAEKAMEKMFGRPVEVTFWQQL